MKVILNAVKNLERLGGTTSRGGTLGMLKPRRIDVDTDRETLLGFHCRGNYESESPWARATSFEDYREEWLRTSQTDVFPVRPG